MFRVEFRSRVEGKYKTYKVGEEVAGLSHSKLVLVAEPGDEVDVGLDPRRVGLKVQNKVVLLLIWSLTLLKMSQKVQSG